MIAGQAIIPDALPSQEQATVKVMCLYALEIADGRLPGPYSGRAGARVRARRRRPNVTEVDYPLRGRAIFSGLVGVFRSSTRYLGGWKPKTERSRSA